MLPDVDTRLKAILRSMQEVILPAIDPDQRLAMDQANIIIANISMLLGQHDKQIHYQLAEVRDYCAFLRELHSLAKNADIDDQSLVDGGELLAATEQLENTALPLPDEIKTRLRDLKNAVDCQLRRLLESGASSVAQDAEKLVLKYAKAQLWRERAWVVKAGFELEPDKIPPLDNLIAVKPDRENPQTKSNTHPL